MNARPIDQRIMLASANPGKLRELRQLLAPHGLTLIAQDELGIAPVAETGLTFVENALLKARHAAVASGLPALADDSGLEVDALGGAPGVHSARYAGVGAHDAEHCAKLLAALAGIEEARRTARFRCVLVYLRHAADPAPLLCEGVWAGRISTAARGSGGFGYDPIFWLPEWQCTSAELDLATKNALSHRGQALRCLIARASELCGEGPGSRAMRQRDEPDDISPDMAQ